ncbi:MAG TPA: FecR family protein [Puia sp.]|nr:FecR family protein [Puia sp.]
MRGNLFYLLPALAACLTMVSCGAGDATQLHEGAGYHVGKGSGQTFHLPDGTVLVASPETTISLSKGYGKGNREIQLDGEARFDVTARPNWPMVIRTRDLVIEVLGTRFKVNAFRDKPGEEVDVLTGSLRVRKSYHSDTDNEPEVLKDGDMVMINHDIDLMEKEALSPAELEKLKGLW